MIDDSSVEPINPFRFDLEIPWYRYIQIFIACFTLVPFRIVSTIVHTILCYIVCGIATYGLPLQPEKFDLTGWRASFQWFATKVLFRSFRYSLGLRITVKGECKNKAEAPVLILAPHSSIYDNFIIDAIDYEGACPFTVVRMENGDHIMITIFRMIGSIFVNRADADSRLTTKNLIQKRVLDPEWPQLIIWPEGTTHNRLAAPKMKPGAFLPGKPVQPIALKFNNSWDTFTWGFQGPTYMEMLFYSFCQLWVNLELRFLDVVIPTEVEKENPVLFANRCRAVVAADLEVPTIDLDYEDGRALLAAAKTGLPGHTGLINVSYYNKQFGFGREKIYEELEEYSILSQKKELADYDDLSLYLLLPRCDLLKELFIIYDRANMICFTFKDFLNSRIKRAYPAAEKLDYEALMQCLDVDGDGAINETDLCESLPRIFGGSPSIYTQLWNRECNGRKVFELTDLERLCTRIPEYSLLFQLYHEKQQKVGQERTFNG